MAGGSSAGPRRELRRHRQVLARLAFAQFLARPLVWMLQICYDFHYLAATARRHLPFGVVFTVIWRTVPFSENALLEGALVAPSFMMRGII